MSDSGGETAATSGFLSYGGDDSGGETAATSGFLSYGGGENAATSGFLSGSSIGNRGGDNNASGGVSGGDASGGVSGGDANGGVSGGDASGGVSGGDASGDVSGGEASGTGGFSQGEASGTGGFSGSEASGTGGFSEGDASGTGGVSGGEASGGVSGDKASGGVGGGNASGGVTGEDANGGVSGGDASGFSGGDASGGVSGGDATDTSGGDSSFSGDAAKGVDWDKEITEILAVRFPKISTFEDITKALEAKLGRDLSKQIDIIRRNTQFLHQRHIYDDIPILPIQFRDNYYAIHQNAGLPPAIYVPPPISHFGFQSSLAIPPPQQTQTVATEASVDSVNSGKRVRAPESLSKVCRVSPELLEIVGLETLPKMEIVKQIWAYIRQHKLQDPTDKRKIICNDKLQKLFETDITDMFNMNKLLATKHIFPIDPSGSTAQDAKKPKTSVAVAST